MNKLLTALCLSSAVLACAPLQAAWQGNWLVGASGGYTHNRGELNVTLLNDIGRQTVVTPRYQDSGWFLGLLGGYQVRCNGWLLGAELNVDWYDAFSGSDDNNFAYTDASNRGWNATSSYDRDWVVGLTGRMGYEVAPALLPYVRAGLEWSRDEISYLQTLNNNTIAVGADGSEDSIRLVGGLGVEMPVPVSFMTGLTVRGEYDFHTKGKRVEATNVAANNVVSASRKPYEQTIFVSLVWNIL